jgi:hypothetical protein
MFIYFPSAAIKQEYRDLKTSQKPVKVSTTSKQLDEYVYDKNSGFKKVGILGLIVLVNVLFASFAKGRKPFSADVGKNNLITAAVLALYDLSSLGLMFDSERSKKAVFNSEKAKIRMYKEAGLNAIA